MALEPIELGRLAVMQRSPLHYVERRVEHLDLTDDHHYGVQVTQQFVVPPHGGNDEKTHAPRGLLIPLGQFSKDRMPDLRVTAPDGSMLPFLTLKERAHVGEALFSSRWQNLFVDHVPTATRDDALEIWQVMQVTAGQIVSYGRAEAYRAVYRLKGYLVEQSNLVSSNQDLHDFVLSILANDDLWDALRALAESRLLIARMQGVPGRTYVVTIDYTERFHYRGYAKRTVSHFFRRFLAWLGWIGIPVARSVANLGQTSSLWIVQSVPEGLEPLRFYWRKEGHVQGMAEPVSVNMTRAVAERHQEPGEKPERDLVLLDVQLSRSSAIVATIGLAAILLVVSTYVYQALPDLRMAHHHRNEDEVRTVLIGLGSIFAAVPAAIAGALAYRGQAFVQHVSRGPRNLLAVLSAAAAFFAAVVSLKNLGTLTEVMAFALSIYSLIIIGTFGFIQLGPRWSESALSKARSAKTRASPNSCRRWQVLGACVWLAVWLLVVLVFARSQAVLQHKHFLTHEFPVNVWRAWWSWFGL